MASRVVEGGEDGGVESELILCCPANVSDGAELEAQYYEGLCGGDSVNERAWCGRSS